MTKEYPSTNTQAPAKQRDLKLTVQKRAEELGFDACRFTSAEPPTHSRHFERWLNSRHHGDMAYLQRNAHKRVDPQKVLTGARTIITLAVSYAADPVEGLPSSAQARAEPTAIELAGLARQTKSGAEPPHSKTCRTSVAAGQRDSVLECGSSVPLSLNLTAAGAGSGRQPAGSRQAAGTTGLLARYARFTDYHDVIGERLKLLSEFVNQCGGVNTRSLWYVDTGPLLERDLAQRAGLGFIGKHTNLISRKLGNWFFLAEIITTLQIEPDAPEPNRCGTCTRCITACPTGAITAPFQLDARRCISYLTIELKGAIPEHLRPAMGNRIFGCDDCLEVCPWNRFAREGSLMKRHARPDFETPDLLELLALDDVGFKRRFAGTPILRAKRRGLLRNVCVALGNIGDESVLPALERAATDPEPLIREHADWAIRTIRKRADSGQPAEAVMP